MLEYCFVLLLCMEGFVFSYIVVSQVIGDFTCDNDKIYVKLIMKTGPSAREESFRVKDGDINVYSSVEFENYGFRTLEQCFSVSVNNQYTLEMIDGFSDSWSGSSYLEIRGIYENIFFKNYMTQSSTETHPLSLYYAVNKNSTWQFASATAPSDWNTLLFNADTWTNYVSETIVSASGPHYFRQSFTGLSKMAAIDVRMMYKNGIVAYINGEEIYRDNMPEGVILASTASTGSYKNSEYHGIVRSAKIASSASVLAVEIHFSNSTVHSNSFGAFIAMLAPSVSTGDECFVYSDIPSITGNSLNTVRALDFLKGNFMSDDNEGQNVILNFAYTGLVKPTINGISIYPSSSPSFVPRDFVFSSLSSGESTSVQTDIAQVSNWVYDANVAKTECATSLSLKASMNYRLLITATSAGIVRIPELQLLVCTIPDPTSIVISPATMKAYIRFSSVEFRPVKNGFGNCTVVPQLPSGLTVNENCVVSGVPTSSLVLTTFTMSTTQYGGVNGTFVLTVEDCVGSMIEVKRKYGYSGYNEGYELRDTATGALIFKREINDGQINNSEEVNKLCVSAVRISVEVSCIGAFWNSNSYLYINAIVFGEEKEPLLRIRKDNYLGIPVSHIVDVEYKLQSHSSWYYKFDSIPAIWHSDSTDGFTQAVVGSFPVATSRVQLYKKSFMVGSLANTAGFVIGMRYKYGCIVYLNGREVFRNHINGDLTTESIADGSFTSLNFHFVSLPITTIASESTSSVDYISEGINHLAIALVAIAPSQTTTNFDCVVRLLANTESRRIMDFVASRMPQTEDANNVFDMNYENSISSYQCGDNYVQLVFNNDRREWVSSFMIQNDYVIKQRLVRSFIFQARNNNNDAWTTLKTVAGLTWSTAGQQRKIWVENNTPYNQYRWSNFATGESDCSWKVQQLALFSDNTRLTVPTLTYESISVFTNIEMAELYPSSELYTDFSVNPPLPTGITIDPLMGVVSGTATHTQTLQIYTVSANKVIGGTVTATFSLSVEVCHNGQNLVTVVLQTDTYPDENSWSLYRGRDVSVTPERSVSPFPVRGGQMFVDMCLKHGIYTFQGRESFGDGWSTGAGGRITIDQGSLTVNMFTLPDCEGSPCIVNVPFTTLMPFQIYHEEWKLYKGNAAVSAGWKDIAFDDKEWETSKAANIGTNAAVTTYLRKSFKIPSLTDYHVMNAHVLYKGGVVAYLNGNIVARFNMPDTFNANTQSLALHDISKYSNFHVILIMAGAVDGTNVMSFEIHQPLDGSSADRVFFDASAILGVEDCSIVVDSYTDIAGTEPSYGTATNMLDLDVSTSCRYESLSDQMFSWAVENQQGSHFNAYGFVVSASVSSWSFSFHGRSIISTIKTENGGDQDFTVLGRTTPTIVNDRVMNKFDVPVGVMGFKQFKWQSINAGTGTSIYSFYTQYCKSNGVSCPAIGEFPAVGQGQMSPSTCSVGYNGYRYRVCGPNGVLGEIKTERCIPKPPTSISYEKNRFQFIMDVTATTGVPKYDCIINQFYLDENVILPDGLKLDEKTGEISGLPLSVIDNLQYIIYARNAAGIISTPLYIAVRKGTCVADEFWPKTEVGAVSVYNCALKGSYVGSMKRECILGIYDGVWGKANGVCISVAAIAILIIVVILVVLVVIFVILRVTSRSKSVGGMRKKAVVRTVNKQTKVDEKTRTKIIKV